MSASASAPGFPHVPSIFSSFSFSQSLSRLNRPPWRALGATTAVVLGLSFTASRVPVLAEKKALLERAVADEFKECVQMTLTSFNCLSPFASLSVAPIEDSVEPKTGVVFAGEASEGKYLTGFGLRKKSIFGLKNITVYAYGLYADPDSLKSCLGTKYNSSKPVELANSSKDELLGDITASDVGLTVRLIIVYGKLKIGSIRSAFEESVGKGLKKFSGDDNKELLGRFTSLFTDDLQLPKGTTIDLTRLPGQVLQTTINGEDIGSVQSPLLCQALFDLYVGEEAFDLKARETMGQGLTTMLST